MLGIVPYLVSDHAVNMMACDDRIEILPKTHQYSYLKPNRMDVVNQRIIENSQTIPADLNKAFKV